MGMVQPWFNAEMAEFKLLVGSGGLEFPQGIEGMDSLNKHVEQICFRQCVTFCEHRQLKGRQPHFQPTETKSSVYSSHMKTQSVSCNNSWKATTPWPNPLLLRMRQVFSAVTTKAWAWCSHNAEPVEHAAALRNLKLLGGSGGLDFTKGMAGIDSWNKHVQHISVPQFITFCEHRQLKGWKPRFQLTVAKSSISTIVRWLAAVT